MNRARCPSGNQSCRDGGSSKPWSRWSVRNRLPIAISYGRMNEHSRHFVAQMFRGRGSTKSISDTLLDRTLVVMESQELLRGQKRGIAVALRKAKLELGKLERRVASGRIQREAMEGRVQKVLQREHLSDFVIATVKETGGQYHSPGTSTRHEGVFWSARAWAGAFCVRTITTAVTV